MTTKSFNAAVAMSSEGTMLSSIASLSSVRSSGLIIKRKLSSEQFIKVAKPGAIDTNISLEKKPIMQSTYVADWKHGINTSSIRGSFGSM